MIPLVKLNDNPVTNCFRHPDLYVTAIEGKGRAVIALNPIKSGSLMEITPVIPLTEEEVDSLRKTVLYNYIFEWKKSPFIDCVVLGIISNINHSSTPNAKFERDYDMLLMKLTSIKDIDKNQEITIDYNCDLWFEEKRNVG